MRLSGDRDDRGTDTRPAEAFEAERLVRRPCPCLDRRRCAGGTGHPKRFVVESGWRRGAAGVRVLRKSVGGNRDSEYRRCGGDQGPSVLRADWDERPCLRHLPSAIERDEPVRRGGARTLERDG